LNSFLFLEQKSVHRYRSSLLVWQHLKKSLWVDDFFCFSCFRLFVRFSTLFLFFCQLSHWKSTHSFSFLRSCIRIATLSILCFISICCVAVLDFLAVWTLPRTLFLYISIIIKVFRPVNVICVYFVIPRQDKIGREVGTHEQVLLSYAGIALFKPLLFWEKVNDDS